MNKYEDQIVQTMLDILKTINVILIVYILDAVKKTVE